MHSFYWLHIFTAIWDIQMATDGSDENMCIDPTYHGHVAMIYYLVYLDGMVISDTITIIDKMTNMYQPNSHECINDHIAHYMCHVLYIYIYIIYIYNLRMRATYGATTLSLFLKEKKCPNFNRFCLRHNHGAQLVTNNRWSRKSISDAKYVLPIT